MDGEVSKAPDRIKDFSVRTTQIPKMGLIEELIGTCNSVKNVLDSNSKFRRKRNSIAHKAEEIGSEAIYLGYKNAVDLAIKQLLTKLSQKINTGE